MRNEKKIEFLEQHIDKLEKENNLLKQENITLSIQLEENKNTILLRNKLLDEKEKSLDKLRETYKGALLSLKEQQKTCRKALYTANKAKNKFEKEMRRLLDKMKKQNK